jgi:flagellar hook-length control protein FliK
MLDAHQARTAIAEGHNEKPEPAHDAAKPAQSEDQHDAPAKTDDGSQTDASDAATTAVLAAALPTPIDVSTAPAASEPVPAATQMVVAGGAPTPVVQVIKPGDAAEVPVVAPALPGAPSADAVAAAPVAVADTAAAAGAPVKADPAQAQPAQSAQPEAAKPTAAPGPAHTGADGSPDQPQQQQPDGKAAQTLQQARAAVAYARPAAPQQAQTQAHAGQPAEAPSPIAPATSAAPAAAPATPTSAATPVPLARAAEAVEHVLRLASSRGVTHARIALNPADLGAVDVHIRSTAEGLVARVVAHSAEAVQTLQHAAGDLRRSLEEQGLNVLNLDISQPGESGAGRAGSESNGRNTHDGETTTEADESATTETKTLRLPSGVLVDVLA